MSEPLVELQNLAMKFAFNEGFFGKRNHLVNAVDGVSLKIHQGETLGLVGESGSGKSTLGRCLLRLIKPTAGKIFFDKKDITDCSEKELRPLRKQMQIIFQDPYASLNPNMSVLQIIEEPMIIHDLYENKKARQERVSELLELVGLSPESKNKYPHHFSGGQRQRIGIARALSVNPRFIVCDEPVSSLDVSIQAQIINLLLDLQKKFSLTYLFISHDLKLVEHFSNRIAVMQAGRIVELNDVDGIFNSPRHPYTKTLLDSILMPR